MIQKIFDCIDARAEEYKEFLKEIVCIESHSCISLTGNLNRLIEIYSFRSEAVRCLSFHDFCSFTLAKSTAESEDTTAD